MKRVHFSKNRTRALSVTTAIILCLWLALILLGNANRASAKWQGQIPTVSVPTVTSSPIGAIVTVTREYDQVNVRGGPGGDGVYPIVGVLIAGQQVPRTAAGVPSMQVIISGYTHMNWFGPSDISGYYALSWQKTYLEGDTRWKPLLSEQIPGVASMQSN